MPAQRHRIAGDLIGLCGRVPQLYLHAGPAQRLNKLVGIAAAGGGGGDRAAQRVPRRLGPALLFGGDLLAYAGPAGGRAVGGCGRGQPPPAFVVVADRPELLEVAVGVGYPPVLAGQGGDHVDVGVVVAGRHPLTAGRIAVRGDAGAGHRRCRDLGPFGVRQHPVGVRVAQHQVIHRLVRHPRTRPYRRLQPARQRGDPVPAVGAADRLPPLRVAVPGGHQPRALMLVAPALPVQVGQQPAHPRPPEHPADHWLVTGPGGTARPRRRPPARRPAAPAAARRPAARPAPHGRPPAARTACSGSRSPG